MADTQAKHWLKSKTIRWHALLVGVGAAMSGLSTQLAPLTQQLGAAGMPAVWVSRTGIALAILGIAGGYLRTVTTQPLTTKRTDQ